jgi:tRNA (guanine-N7-)-methyltransferase
MARQKLRKFAENSQTGNIVEPGKELYDKIKGNWNKEFFKNENPLTVELACGRGEYTIGLASVTPERNYIGVDIKGDRMNIGSRYAIEKGMKNVGFLRIYIQNLEQFFAEKEVNEIWITFPDPRPKNRDARRRLTSPRFLNIYRNILAKGGVIHLKTDNLPLFEYTLETLEKEGIKNVQHTFDLYNTPELLPAHSEIKTKYENIYLEKGVPIKYLRFSLS